MAKQTKKSKETVIKPSIQVAGDKHVFETLFEGEADNLPEIRSVGFMKVSPNSKDYVSYVITTKGTDVISIEVDEPNLKIIAEESAKTNFVNLFIDSGV